jgi:hypothetical protein
MNAAAPIVSVRRVTDDITECRRCHQIIAHGRRVAFVAGVGNVCLPCVVSGGQADDTDHDGSTDQTGDTRCPGATAEAAAAASAGRQPSPPLRGTP